MQIAQGQPTIAPANLPRPVDARCIDFGDSSQIKNYGPLTHLWTGFISMFLLQTRPSTRHLSSGSPRFQTTIRSAAMMRTQHGTFKSVQPIQYIAADAGMKNGSAQKGVGALSWGIWRIDPGPRGVRLRTTRRWRLRGASPREGAGASTSRTGGSRRTGSSWRARSSRCRAGSTS